MVGVWNKSAQSDQRHLGDNWQRNWRSFSQTGIVSEDNWGSHRKDQRALIYLL